MDAYTALEISLVETSGPFLNPQRPHLVLWLHAIQVRGGFSGARAVALVRSPKGDRWEECVRSVSPEEVDEVLELLSEIGVPGRDLRVRGTIDTSDTWSKLLLRVQLNDKGYTLNLDMLASGFEGEDAEGLRRLLGKVFGLIGEDIRSMSI